MTVSSASKAPGSRTLRKAPLAFDLDQGALTEVQTLLVDWFSREGRDLPWRRTRDPWGILVAEVMLQQIQVARAIPFWEAFLQRFPTPAALAQAPLSAAIRVWGDLGRYRRVVDLHRTAGILVEEYAGQVPDDPEVLRTMPGIGPYTAGATACFAFERDASFVDTNIRRVLHRLFVGLDVPQNSASNREIEAIAARAVPAGAGWSWNQGLMDLGAMICTPRKPKCERCPVSGRCLARPAMEVASESKRVSGNERGVKPSYRYEGTNRYFRGRVLEQLRALPPEEDEAGLRLSDLGARLRPGYSGDDLPWLLGVVHSLEEDGLALAEERAVYDGGGDSGGVVVKLPTRSERAGHERSAPRSDIAVGWSRKGDNGTNNDASKANSPEGAETVGDTGLEPVTSTMST